jgi:hypothetical protein
MPRLVRALLSLTALFVAIPVLAQAQQDSTSLRLRGPDSALSVLTHAALERLPQVDLPLTFRDGSRHTLRGPMVSDVLAAAGLANGTNLRGPLARTVVLARALDGYAVAFALAEVDPALTDRRIIVALTQDGAGLPDRDAPFRLVTEGDQRPPRWIRQVIELQLVEVGP